MTLLPQAEWWRPQPAAAIGSAWPSAPVAASGTTGSRLAFRALLAFTFILVLAPQSFVPALQPFRIALVAAAVGIAAQLVERLAHGRPVTVMGREMVLVAVLLAWSVVTVPWSLWPGGSVSFLLDAYFKTVAIFWLLANTVDTVDRLRTLAWSLTAMAVPLALTGLKNFMSGDFLGSNRILGYEAGLTANPNDLALMLNLLLPLGVALLLSSRGALARSVLVVVVLLEAAAVIVTFSRAGFLSLATCVALYLWRLVRRGLTGWVLAAFVAGVAGMTLLPGSYMARLATITDIDSDPTGSAQSRWEDTQAAVRYVMANPFMTAVQIGSNKPVVGVSGRIPLPDADKPTKIAVDAIVIAPENMKARLLVGSGTDYIVSVDDRAAIPGKGSGSGAQPDQSAVELSLRKGENRLRFVSTYQGKDESVFLRFHDPDRKLRYPDDSPGK